MGRILFIIWLVIIACVGLSLLRDRNATTQGEEIYMVQPGGSNPDRDLTYSQTNLNNAEANKLNAEGHVYNAQATAIVATIPDDPIDTALRGGILGAGLGGFIMVLVVVIGLLLFLRK
jgi:hypothetical protein